MKEKAARTEKGPTSSATHLATHSKSGAMQSKQVKRGPMEANKRGASTAVPDERSYRENATMFSPSHSTFTKLRINIQLNMKEEESELGDLI